MTPVVSAVWSCDPTTALAYPARYLFTFLGHHGLLGVSGSPQWRTVTGGSRTYVDKVAATLPDIRLSSPVTGVRRHAHGVELTTTTGSGTVTTENFDAVVIATHPAQALDMLTDASPAEREALGGMPYSVNHTVFHRDAAVLPSSDNAKASWNYRLPVLRRPAGQGPGQLRHDPAAAAGPRGPGALHRQPGRIRADRGRHGDRAHGLRAPAVHPGFPAAQQRILALGDDRLAFAGAYHGWGFHEDGALSGVQAAERLGRDWDDPAVALDEEYGVAVDPDLQTVPAEGS